MTEFPRIDTSKYTVTETGQVIKDEVTGDDIENEICLLAE